MLVCTLAANFIITRACQHFFPRPDLELRIGRNGGFLLSDNRDYGPVFTYNYVNLETGIHGSETVEYPCLYLDSDGDGFLDKVWYRENGLIKERKLSQDALGAITVGDYNNAIADCLRKGKVVDCRKIISL